MRVRRWCVLVSWLGWVWCGAAQGALRLACPTDAGPRCVENNHGHDEHIFHVDGTYLKITFKEGVYFEMESGGGNLTLDNTALPSFNGTFLVNYAVLTNFPVPSRAYARALAAFNVEPGERLELRRGAGTVQRRHLLGLEHYGALVLTGLRLAPDALGATPRLRRLRLDSVGPQDVAGLPPALQELQLVGAGDLRLDRAALERFPNLTSLIVRDDAADVFVEPLAPLAELALQARAARVAPALPPTLDRLTLLGWAEEAPTPWSGCAGLTTLKVSGAAAPALPGGWLASCARLSELHVRAPKLATLAQDALWGARALRRVTISRSRLRALPVRLLADARELTQLDLSANRLEELQGGLFASTKNLTDLNLSLNELPSAAFEALSGVESLRVLRLDHNVRLGDACDGGLNGIRSSSKLEYLKSLSQLSLRNTSAHYICRDWRNMRLAALDLRHNLVRELTYADLQFRSATAVDLSGNNVTRLLYTEADLAALELERAAYCERGPGGAAPPSAWRAHVTLDSALHCDCALGWAARALRRCPAHVRLAPLRCSSGAALSAVEPAELLCAVPPPACPAPCRCEQRAEPPKRRVMRLTCERAALQRLPRLPMGAWAWELRLAHNSISSLRVSDLPPHVLELDLRDNGMKSADAGAALLGAARRVLLADNPLRCACDDAAALDLLRARLPPDHNVTCDGGAALRPPADCAVGAAALLPLLLLLLPVLLALGALGACAARPEWRARVKKVLRELGWLPRAPEAADERPYDAFLSFSHHDEEVAGAVLAELEGGAAPYRLLVHYRDWAPGGWIPAQIAASVRRSRRTVALVSRHFLASGWARAEFREAYGAALREARPRLVVVLLDEPARLPLDDELRRYLGANTYVRWGDPWFWRKLRAALPPPRGPQPAPAPAPAAPAPAPSQGSAEPLMLQLSVDALATELRATA